jgi:two-component system response regulator YesN
MNRTWFRRMIWSYVPLFLILFSVIAVAFFQMMLEQHRKNTADANGIFVYQLMQYVDVSLKSIERSVVAQIVTDPLILRFMEMDGDLNVSLNYKVTKKLNALKQELPYIHSIYLIRYNDKLMFSGNVVKPYETFQDYKFLREMEQSSFISKWTGVRPYREFPSQEYQSVVSLVRKMPSAGNEGIVVINVNADHISNMVQGMYDSSALFVSILDAEGKSVYGASSDPNRVLSQIRSQYTGWSIESGLTKDGWIGAVHPFYGSWFLIGVLVFAAGIVMLIYITRKNYIPLRDLVSRIGANEDAGPWNTMSANEFQWIEQTMQRYIQRSEDVEKQVEEAVPLKKRHLFLELMNGSRKPTEAEFRRETAAFGLPSELLPGIAILVEIDHYERRFLQFGERDRYLFKFVLQSVLKEQLGHRGVTGWAEWVNDQRLGVMVTAKHADDSVAEGCSAFVRWVEEHLTFTVTVGLGDPGRLQDIGRSFREAGMSLQYKPVLGINRVITAQQVHKPAEPLAKTTVPVPLIHEMVEAYRLQEEIWAEKFEHFFQELRNDMSSKDDIQVLIHYFIYYLDRQMSHFPHEYQELWRREALSHMLSTVKQFETLAEIEGAFLHSLRSFAQQTAALREAKSNHHLLLQVRKYIEENFANPDLSLHHLSEKFEISSKYVSQLFKEEFGENFLDFLMRIRIETAKQLLRDEKHSIQEVGDQVGYTNPATFRRAFRRIAGVAPGDFRNQRGPVIN